MAKYLLSAFSRLFLYTRRKRSNSSAYLFNFYNTIMSRELKNKVAVVTGGAMGIGYQIVNYFLKHEAKLVIILDINKSAGNEAVTTLNKLHGDGKAVFMKCDVTKDLEVISNEIFKNYKVDILVNNAGIADETDLRKTLEVNTIAVVEWGMKFWEQMRKDNGGSGGTIVNIASTCGYTAEPWYMFYTTSKHGVVGFTKTLGHPFNYKKTEVRVIAICPGYTDTNLRNAIHFEYHKADIANYVKTVIFQKAETVGQAVVDIFKVAESGTTWVSKENRPIEQVPANLNKITDI